MVAAASARGTVTLSPLARSLIWQVPGGEFVFAGDHGQPETAAVGVFELLAQFLGLGINLDPQPGAAQSSGRAADNRAAGRRRKRE